MLERAEHVGKFVESLKASWPLPAIAVVHLTEINAVLQLVIFIFTIAAMIRAWRRGGRQS